MKDPIKIIHKFKNDNRKIQYKIYIFIGSLVDPKIMTILEIIKSKDLYNTLISLSPANYKLLEIAYGMFWYETFFISYHIINQFKLINTTISKKKEIETKYGTKWYAQHITKPPVQKVLYSFSTNYYKYNIERNKIKTYTHKIEMDFTTYNKQTGGGGDEDHKVDTEPELNPDTNSDTEIIETITDNDFQEQIEEDFNLDEITKLYAITETESDKTNTETSKLISEAINDKSWNKTFNNLINIYDTSLDNAYLDMRLEDVFNKYYITEQFIYKDDTIKTMRNKIATIIPVSPKFGENIRLLPETQYLWLAYNINETKDFVMIGQKWIRKNELLKIDIEPNPNLIVYEKLREKLSYLKDNFQHKIKREDDETNILQHYENYITMNEIFMLDIYNELGQKYNPVDEDKKNLFDVYISIYFPLIIYDRLEQIIQLLNGSNIKELQFIDLQYKTLCNDVKLETEIENTIESAKIEMKEFNDYFSTNHILQATININLNNPKNLTGTTSDFKFNLYRIFDNFIVNDRYPFITYQPLYSQIIHKFYTLEEKIENADLISKWFENSPNGISFKIKLDNQKIKIDNKFINIILYETGKIEYKITWKEENKATETDIIDTYEIVKELINKINSENKKIKIILPTNDLFKFAFINSIQKFTLPNKFKIDHNDLSEFSRFFFPYVSMIIDPKKRLSKKNVENESSKYGTYLRYKRVNKFDNKTKIHLRILYFLRNYELNDRELIDEISKQFNMTIEAAAKNLDYVRDKFQKFIKRSSKILKKLKSMPKIKQLGVSINVQGRDSDNYKIRINGARNQTQLDEIISFMKSLLYIYVETYLYKKKDYQKLKETLKSLTKIAIRRNKVSQIVEYDTTVKNIKVISSLDKARLGFKPEKGQSQWSRSCQNSGNDKKRQPAVIAADEIDKLLSSGYILNEKTGYYEKEISIKIKGKEHMTRLKAIKLSGVNETFNYYSCNPSENKDYMYIGFLSKGNNPDNLCMPCCYKKDHSTSTNKSKKNYFLKCTGESIKDDTQKNTLVQTLNDKLYILQETNKVQEGRFIILPKYLDIFFNKIWNHDNKIKNHYLYESKSGYFFKYTVKHDYFYFLVAISNIYEISIPNLIIKMVSFLEKDKSNVYFTFLNNGNISETFKNVNEYIKYIKSSNYLEYDIIGELIAIPGVISEKGINYYILNKQVITIKKSLEKEEIKENFYLECLNNENNFQFEQDRDIIILIKDQKYYFPIYRVKKTDKDKKIILEKFFKNTGYMEKIIVQMNNYYNKSCKTFMINYLNSNNNIAAKNIIPILLSNKINIIKQYIDDRHKCKYIELENGLLLPTKLSGISYDYPFSNIRTIKTNWLNLTQSIKILNNINKILNLDYIPKTIYYDNKKDNNINIISILLNNNLILQINNEIIDMNKIKSLGLSIRYQPLEETINKEIINYNNEIIYDSRYADVKQHNYISEGYNLFRLELSLFFYNNETIKTKIIEIVKNIKIDLTDKKNELRKMLFEIIDSKLVKNNKNNTISYIVDELPNLKHYIINNIRDYCSINTKDTCNTNLNCIWKNDKCKLQLLDTMAVDYVNKVLEEIVEDGIKFKELIQEDQYYVSDIVEYSQYTNRNNQHIIKTSNMNISKLMEELIGNDKIKNLNKKHNNNIIIEDEIPELIELGNQFIQIIVPNKDSIIRAYINAFFWINNPLYDIESRNLGYINELQTKLTYLFKAKIIDFIQTNLFRGDTQIKSFLEKYFKNQHNFFESTLNKFRKTSLNTDGIVELFILSHLIDIPIVIYDNFSNIKYIFLQGNIDINEDSIKKFTDINKLNKTIFIKFDLDAYNNIPKNIYSIYYL